MTTATAVTPRELSIPFEASLDILKADEDEKGQWILEGFASTTDRDLQNEVVTQEAINASASDLTSNSTVLLNHDQKIPIGRVLESEARKGGLFIKVLISKTVPDVWTKIKEGVLNKFSIRGKVIDAVKEWNEALGKFVKVIKKMFLVEVSLVSVPANPNAKAMRWYIEKAFSLWESEGGELQTIDKTGGQIMKDGIATADPKTEKDGVPEIVKDEEGNTDETPKADDEVKKNDDGEKADDKAEGKGDEEVKKDEGETEKADEELVKAATTHAALVKEKTEAVMKLAKEIADGAGTMSASELQDKINQLERLGWKIGDDAQVVQAMGGTAKAEAKAEGDADAGTEGEGEDGGDDTTSKSEGGDADLKKGFPDPESLLKEWGEFCKENELDGELDNAKVFAKWVEFCKAKGYPEPYAYPYDTVEKADDEKVMEISNLVDSLMDGADDAAKAVLGQIKALLGRMMGGASPHPTPTPPKGMKPNEEEEKPPMHKGDDGADDDIEKKGAKMKSSRLSTLKSIIEKLQGLLGELDDGTAKALDELTKNLADETKAEESLEELKKTLAVEARQTLSDIMEPIEKRLERIESIEGIRKSEKGQEKTPDEKPDKKKPKADGEKSKTGGVFSGILGNSLERAKRGLGS